jgi:hypothetical protein
MTRFLPIAAAWTLVLGAGIVHGLWTQRWRPSQEVEAAVARIDHVPMELGDWKGEGAELDPEAVAQARVSGCWMRRYTQQSTGAKVSVLLMCGRAGPLSVHTPEWCYGGAGFAMAGPAVKHRVRAEGDSRSAEFWTARFTKARSALPEHLRIFWAWNAEGDWKSPQWPRLEFGRCPVLFKMYVMRNLADVHESLDTDPCVALLGRLLPELERSLFAR